MELPSPTIYVAPHRLKLWYDADACTAGGVRGQYLGDEGKVLLDPRLPLGKMFATVIHEVVHAMLESSPLTSGKDRQVDPELEEQFATEMERGFTALLLDNSWMLDVASDLR